MGFLLVDVRHRAPRTRRCGLVTVACAREYSAARHRCSDRRGTVRIGRRTRPSGVDPRRPRNGSRFTRDRTLHRRVPRRIRRGGRCRRVDQGVGVLLRRRMAGRDAATPGRLSQVDSIVGVAVARSRTGYGVCRGGGRHRPARYLRPGTRNSRATAERETRSDSPGYERSGRDHCRNICYPYWRNGMQDWARSSWKCPEPTRTTNP